jgi:beta-fructofuranosidase
MLTGSGTRVWRGVLDARYVPELPTPPLSSFYNPILFVPLTVETTVRTGVIARSITIGGSRVVGFTGPSRSVVFAVWFEVGQAPRPGGSHRRASRTVFERLPAISGYSMNLSPVSVGLVAPAEPTAEQAAALEWARDAVGVAEHVTPRGIADVTAGRYDVLWWHADEPPATDAVEAAAPAVRAHVRDGGGLLLSLRALEAVATLGVDPVPPDATGIDDHHDPSGPLWKAVHADYRAFDGFDDLRVATLPPGVHPFARYDAVLPERGEVLAATVNGSEDWPDQVSAVAWPTGGEVGDRETDRGEGGAAAGDAGPVVGVGAGLRFALGEGHAEARQRLAGNVLATLADGPDEGLGGRPKTAAQLRAAREDLDADDHHRPAYHVSPPGNWLNDPNGLVHHDGTYHVFYQYNPGGPSHDTIHWGHATSEDLVTWRDRPVALRPSPDGPDRDGCWSGCAVVVDGTPTVLYTGGRGRDQLPCRATAADDELTRWVKDVDNPIVEAPPEELDVLRTEHWDAEFRDHAVWREDGSWYQLIGSGLRGVGGTALLYRATDDDLREWTFVAPLLVGDWPGAGDIWECPELLSFGEWDLLHVSNYEDVVYFLGRADPAEGSFDVEHRGPLDHGDLYAPQSTTALDGRQLTWGWIPEARPVGTQWDAGWSGVLSLPRVLDVEDGTLRQRPARELEALRDDRVGHVEGPLAAGERTVVARGGALEVATELDPAGADAVALDVLAAPDDSERTTLRLTAAELVLDRSASSLAEDVDAEPRHIPLPASHGPTELRVFVDGSVVEAFVDGRLALASRVYPTCEDSDRVRVRAEGGRASVASLDAWRLGSAW